jgi:Fis family transcriptional regulator
MSNKPRHTQLPLSEYVRQVARDYLCDMDNTDPETLHKLFIATVEPPLIEEVLKKTCGNQSHAARILGITRNTLRGKMRQYGIKA